MARNCKHCGGLREDTHQEEHVELCCDCFDLSFGMPLEQINDERKLRGEPPITKEWKDGQKSTEG